MASGWSEFFEENGIDLEHDECITDEQFDFDADFFQSISPPPKEKNESGSSTIRRFDRPRSIPGEFSEEELKAILRKPSTNEINVTTFLTLPKTPISRGEKTLNLKSTNKNDDDDSSDLKKTLIHPTRELSSNVTRDCPRRLDGVNNLSNISMDKEIQYENHNVTKCLDGFTTNLSEFSETGLKLFPSQVLNDVTLNKTILIKEKPRSDKLLIESKTLVQKSLLMRSQGSHIMNGTYDQTIDFFSSVDPKTAPNSTFSLPTLPIIDAANNTLGSTFKTFKKPDEHQPDSVSKNRKICHNDTVILTDDISQRDEEKGSLNITLSKGGLHCQMGLKTPSTGTSVNETICITENTAGNFSNPVSPVVREKTFRVIDASLKLTPSKDDIGVAGQSADFKPPAEATPKIPTVSKSPQKLSRKNTFVVKKTLRIPKRSGLKKLTSAFTTTITAVSEDTTFKTPPISTDPNPNPTTSGQKISSSRFGLPTSLTKKLIRKLTPKSRNFKEVSGESSVNKTPSDDKKPVSVDMKTPEASEKTNKEVAVQKKTGLRIPSLKKKTYIPEKNPPKTESEKNLVKSTPNRSNFNDASITQRSSMSSRLSLLPAPCKTIATGMNINTSMSSSLSSLGTIRKTPSMGETLKKSTNESFKRKMNPPETAAPSSKSFAPPTPKGTPIASRVAVRPPVTGSKMRPPSCSKLPSSKLTSVVKAPLSLRKRLSSLPLQTPVVSSPTTDLNTNNQNHTGNAAPVCEVTPVMAKRALLSKRKLSADIGFLHSGVMPLSSTPALPAPPPSGVSGVRCASVSMRKLPTLTTLHSRIGRINSLPMSTGLISGQQRVSLGCTNVSPIYKTSSTCSVGESMKPTDILSPCNSSSGDSELFSDSVFISNPSLNYKLSSIPSTPPTTGENQNETENHESTIEPENILIMNESRPPLSDVPMNTMKLENKRLTSVKENSLMKFSPVDYVKYSENKEGGSLMIFSPDVVSSVADLMTFDSTPDNLMNFSPI